jgi:hypothetical protein
VDQGTGADDGRQSRAAGDYGPRTAQREARSALRPAGERPAAEAKTGHGEHCRAEQGFRGPRRGPRTARRDSQAAGVRSGNGTRREA